MVAGSHVEFRAGNGRHQRSVILGPSYEYGVDRTYRFGNIAILGYWRLALKLPIHVVISLRMRRINGKFSFGVETVHIFGLVGGRFADSTFNFQRISFLMRGVYS